MADLQHVEAVIIVYFLLCGFFCLMDQTKKKSEKFRILKISKNNNALGRLRRGGSVRVIMFENLSGHDERLIVGV